MRMFNINDLIPADYNPRKALKSGDAEYEKLKNSIKEFGYVDPVIVNARSGNVVGGHQRLQVLKDLGHTELSASVVDLSDEQEKALNIALNKIAGEWDLPALTDLLEDLDASGFDLELTGFDLDELDELLGAADPDEGADVEEDEFEGDPEAIEEPVTRLGDVWEIGPHRLLCGDSTSPRDLAYLMDGREADLVFTDPPYGMKKEADGVLNDNLNHLDLLEFNKQWIPLTMQHLKSNGSWYCWGIDGPLMDIYCHILRPLMNANEITFRNLITWAKPSGMGQLSENTRMYAVTDEKCLFIMKGRQEMNETKEDYDERFEPYRLAINDLAQKVGKKQVVELTNTAATHWWARSQFEIPKRDQFEKVLAVAAEQGHDVNIGPGFLDELRELYKIVSAEHRGRRAYFDNLHDNMNNVWQFKRHNRDGSEGEHATPKPLELCARGIKTSSREGELVLDVFGGSGSTLIAADRLKRECFMIELDPRYCDIIIQRYILNKENSGENVFLHRNGERIHYLEALTMTPNTGAGA